MTKLSLFLLSLASTLFLACGSGGGLSGTATDTENTVAGIVLKADSSAAVNVAVRMVAATSTANLLDSTRTDSTGYFKFAHVTADTFNLEFRYGSGESVLESGSRRALALKPGEALKLNVRLSRAAYVAGVLSVTNASGVNVGSFSVNEDSSSFGSKMLAGDSFLFVADAGPVNLVIAPADTLVVARLLAKGYPDSLVHQRISLRLDAGDTLDIGSYAWKLPAIDSLGVISRKVLSGVVLDTAGKPAAGVSVHIVTDLYGFSVSDSSTFITQTVTDSLGRWFLQAPDTSVVDSAFRVEFQYKKNSETRTLVGASDYVLRSALEDDDDTLDIGDTRLQTSASFLGKISLVIGNAASTDTLCWNYTIKVGFKGTSHFTRVSACAAISMSGLVPGAQDLIYYSGDNVIVNGLIHRTLSPADYVRNISVSLPMNGGTLENQGLTYTPPTVTSISN